MLVTLRAVLRRVVTAVMIAGLVGSCAGAGRPELTDQTLPGRACSAEGMVVGPVDSDGLPSPVAARRQELIDAAVACDYRVLARLARQDGADLRFEGEVVPVRQWRERERDGIAILAPLAGILGLGYARRDDAAGRRFTWPDAVEWPFADVADARDRAALVEVVGEEGVFGWAEAGGYAGWRTSIGPDGQWLRFWYGPVDGEYAPRP